MMRTSTWVETRHTKQSLVCLAVEMRYTLDRELGTPEHMLMCGGQW